MLQTEEETKLFGVNQQELLSCVKVLEVLDDKLARNHQDEASKVYKRLFWHIDRLSDKGHKRKQKDKGPNKKRQKPWSNHHCYICKHAHEDGATRLCPGCAEFNLEKRLQTADLTGKVCVVTGARIKIGFQTALKLVRAGATVVASTRFVNDAWKRYQQEKDFDAWKDRLFIFRMQCLSRVSVEEFCNIVAKQFVHVDILILNAAQTIFRPLGWYRGLLEGEGVAPESLLADIGTKQLCCDQETKVVPVEDFFPVGVYDAQGQQLDLRKENSWTATLENASVDELLQNFVINATVPFIMIQRFTPLMKTEAPGASHVVCVAAVEGMFNVQHKNDKHPQSNMPKAALHMLVRTTGPSYLNKHRICITAVDTGWCTIEQPLQSRLHKLGPPLDDVDGAARILDPVFTAHSGGPLHSGVLFKDFVVRPW